MENMVEASIGLHFRIDKLDEFRLVTMSKITQDDQVESNLATPARIRNRSWRLLNMRILKGMLREKDAFYGRLTNGLEKNELIEQVQNNNSDGKRPSLFSNNSRSTLFSHNSGSNTESRERMYSCQEDAGDSDDITDISEEDDFDLSDGSSSEDESEARTEQSHKSFNDMYVITKENHKNQQFPLPSNPKATCVRGFSPQNSSVRISPVLRETNTINNPINEEGIPEGSLHDNKASNKNIFFISSSHSPPCQINQYNQNSYDSRTKSMNSENSPASGLIKRQDSLFGNSQQNIDNSVNNNEELNYSSTDISEDDEEDDGDDEDYSSNDNGQQSHNRNVNGAKSMILENSTGDNDSEWISVTSDDEKEIERPIPPLKFEKWSSKGHSSTNIPISNGSLEKDHNMKDGLLKPRSLLSSLFLNEYMTKDNGESMTSNLNPQKPILKRSSTTGIITVQQSSNNIKSPSILFSKKHNSFSELSKKYPHFQNDLVKKNILNSNTDEMDDEDDDTGILGKQKSSVGISNFNVSIQSGSNSFINSNSDVADNNTTKVDTNQINYNSSRHDLLSSSLNKYSKSHSSNSLKNILSKSSLNLSNLFHNSKSKLLRSDSPYHPRTENLRSPVSANATILNIGNNDIVSNGKVDEKPNDDKKDASTEIDIDINVEENIKKNKMISPSNDLKSSPPLKITVNLSPKTTRKSMISKELSQSLKDSIIIDYKLGKVPLPSKVVNNGGIINNEKLFINDFDDTDDYHSKGW